MSAALFAGEVLADGSPADWQRGAVLRGSPDGDAVPAPAAAQPTRDDMAALQEVNRIRAERGLGPIRFEKRLFAAAYAHSLEQIQGDYLGHGAKDPARATLGQRMQAEGYTGRMYAEVVARDYIDARSVVQAWMDSPRHREVLLDPDLAEGAFARVEGQIRGLNRWTGDFGAPVAGYSPTPASTATAPAAPATPSSTARVSLPANNAPRSNVGYAQPTAPMPTSRATAPASAMPPVPAAAPRTFAGSTQAPPAGPVATAIPATPRAASPAPPAPPTVARTATPTQTQPRVTAPMPQVPRVASSTPVPPAAAPRAAAPARSPMVASAPQPSRTVTAPKRMPRRVGDCAT